MWVISPCLPNSPFRNFHKIHSFVGNFPTKSPRLPEASGMSSTTAPFSPQQIPPGHGQFSFSIGKSCQDVGMFPCGTICSCCPICLNKISHQPSAICGCISTFVLAQSLVFDSRDRSTLGEAQFKPQFSGAHDGQ